MGRAVGSKILLGMLILVLADLRAAPAAALDSPQTLETSALQIESGNRRFAFQVELARTPEERRVGLMFRKELAPNRGMLFDFGETSPVAMWMRNTFIPLDMLFIRADGEIANIAHDTVPHSEAVLMSAGPVRAVLEVPAGTSRLLGFQPGDHVLHPVLGAAAE